MATEDIQFHYHTYAVTLEDYINNQMLNRFFKYTAYDEKNGTKFLMQIEARDYPIYAMMFHPEY